MTRYAVLGTGAVGAWYGARLSRAGHDVHFLCRSDFDHVRTQGLLVESPDGDIHLPHAQAYCDVADMPRCDVALVAWKTTSNGALGPALHAVADDTTTVVMLQNGLGNEAAALAASDREPGQVVAGLSFICSHKIGPGHVRHLDYGAVTIAGGGTDRGERLAADLREAGIPVTAVEAEAEPARWRKLVWNVPYNGLCVLLDTTTDALMADDGTRAEVEALMHEVRAAAASRGITIPAEFAHAMLTDTDRMQSYTPSTKLDYDRGARMEVDAIFGAPVRAARIGGVDVPRMALLYRSLLFLDSRSRDG